MSEKKSEPITTPPAAAPIKPTPVFNCIVYLATLPEGKVRARVANLAGLECVAADDRAALQTIVPAFKRRLAELTQGESPVAWIDPPLPTESGERIRLVGVHL